MTTHNATLRGVVAGAVLEAYDQADRALREVEIYAPDVASLIREARDLLFTARTRLDDAE